MAQQSFIFEFGGLAGMALGDMRRTAYSLLFLGQALSSSSLYSKGLCLVMVQTDFSLLLCCVSFLLPVLFDSFVCMSPFSLQRQLQLLTLAEIANNWSASEVFALTMVASVSEISTFASVLLGCDLVNDILQEIMNTTNTNKRAGEPVCGCVESSVDWKRASILAFDVLLNALWVFVALTKAS